MAYYIFIVIYKSLLVIAANMRNMKTRENLTEAIQDMNSFFLNKVQKQVNMAMTLRNWLIGSYIVEYEQLGEDRATYGLMVLATLAAWQKQQDYTC